MTFDPLKISDMDLDANLRLLIASQSKNEPTLREICLRSLYSLNLIKSIPIARFSLQSYLWSVFEDVINRFINDVEKKELVGEALTFKLRYPNVLIETMLKISSEIKYLINYNKNLWAIYFVEWSIHLLLKLLITNSYLKLRPFSTKEALSFWLNCPAIAEIIDIICLGVLCKISNKQHVEIINLIVSTTVSTFPSGNWMFILAIENAPLDTLACSLLQSALAAFSSKFQTAGFIFDLIVLTLEYYPNFVDNLIKASFDLLNDCFKDPLQPLSLFTIPLLLHLITCTLDWVTPHIPEILKLVNSSFEAMLLSQSRSREEALQSALIPKLINLLTWIPQHSLTILKFLISNVTMTKAIDQTIKITYLDILVLLSDKLKELSMINYTKHYIDQKIYLNNRFTSPFLDNLSNLIPELINLLIEHRNSPTSVVLFSLITSVGIYGGTCKMCAILIEILQKKKFIAQHHYMLIEFTGSFHALSPNIATHVSKTILNYFRLNKIISKKFSTILNNFNILMMAERQYMGSKFSTTSYRLALLNVLPKYLTYMNEFPKDLKIPLYRLFSYFENTLLKQPKSIYHAYHLIHNIFKIIISTTSVSLDNNYNYLRYELRLIFRIIKYISNYYPNLNAIILKMIFSFIIKKDAQNYFNCQSFTAVANSKISDENIIKKDILIPTIFLRHSIFQTIIWIIFKSFIKNSSSKTNEMNDNQLHHSCDIVPYIFLISIFNHYEIILEWPYEEDLYLQREKDLKVYTVMESSKILQFILLLIAQYSCNSKYFVAICKSYMAILLAKWDSLKNVKPDKITLENTTFFIDIILKSSWLPSRFYILKEMFKKLTSNQIYIIISCMWTIFKSTTSKYFTANEKVSNALALSSKEPDESHLAPLCDIIKAIIINNIATLNQFYCILLIY